MDEVYERYLVVSTTAVLILLCLLFALLYATA
jgi:hypothetical protein